MQEPSVVKLPADASLRLLYSFETVEGCVGFGVGVGFGAAFGAVAFLTAGLTVVELPYIISLVDLGFCFFTRCFVTRCFFTRRLTGNFRLADFLAVFLAAVFLGLGLAMVYLIMA
jgi:hypothetical protein